MVKAVVHQDGQEESFREKLNIKQLTFAKNDSNGSILEIKKFGKPPIQGQLTSGNLSGKTSTTNNKKKSLRIGSSNNSPIPIELIGADGLRSSKNKKK